MNLKILDFYPSHIRLYRISDKIIVNLYYHIAKEEYYFDEIDLIYKNLYKRIPPIKKKIFFFNKNMYLFNEKKILKIIKKQLFKLIFNNLIFNKNILNLKINLKLI